MDALRAVELRSAADAPQATPEKPRAGTSGFADLVEGAIRNANSELLQAEEGARALARGEADVVDAMISLSRADLALRFVVNLRNRALEAYQQIMRLQV